MKCRGGLDVQMAGRPAGNVVTPPAAKVLHVPTASRRFRFSDVRVQDGQTVEAGSVLATDEANYSVPLLAPAAGTVHLGTAGHITLENPDMTAPAPVEASGTPADRLMALGAWQFFSDAHTGALPDPHGTPVAVIASTVRWEPFTARGDVHLRGRLDAFLRGLTHLQSLLEYQPIYLVMPDVQSAFARHVKKSLRGYAWISVETVPPRYGCEAVSVLARRLGHRPSDGDVIWCLHTEGVFAVDQALTAGQPCLQRIISIGGPCVNDPTHVRVPVGYPLSELLDSRVSLPVSQCRVIHGGVLSGTATSEGVQGVDTECVGFTALQEAAGDEVLGWLRPGSDRRSYSACFTSRLRGSFPERLTTAVRGELRPCISCNFCEEVCPAGIMPHLIHKYLYQDLLEDADAAGIGLCTECGLCSYVCPSKIELRSQLIDGKRIVQEELHGEETPA